MWDIAGQNKVDGVYFSFFVGKAKIAGAFWLAGLLSARGRMVIKSNVNLRPAHPSEGEAGWQMWWGCRHKSPCFVEVGIWPVSVLITEWLL